MSFAKPTLLLTITAPQSWATNTILFLLLGLLPFSVNAQNCAINAGGNQSICLGATFKLDGNIGGPFNASTVTWSVVSQPFGASVSIANPNSFSTTAGTSLLVGTYTFRLSGTCGDGIASQDDVVFTVNTVPAVPTQTSAAFLFACYTGGPVAISGSAPGTGNTVSWYASSGSFSSPTSSTTDYTPYFTLTECGSSSTVDITYTITNAAGCSRSVTRTYTFARKYTFFAQADPAGVCGTYTNLKGSCPGSGTALWTVVSIPSGAPAPVFSSAANRNTTVSNLIPGNYRFNYAVTNASCGNENANVDVFVATGTGVTYANAGADQRYCTMPGTVSLAGNSPAVGEVSNWQLVQGGTAVSIANTSNANITVSGLTNAGSPYYFVYRITAPGGCSTKDTVAIFAEPELTLSNTGPATTCISDYLPSSASAGLRNAKLGMFAFGTLDTVTVSTTYISGPASTVSSVTAIGNSINNNVGGNAPNPTIALGQTSTQTFYNSGNPSNTYELYTRAVGASSIPRENFSYYLVTYLDITAVGEYKYSVTYATRCSTYTAEMTVFRGTTINTNAGSDVYLNCGASTATLAGNIPDGYGAWTSVSRPAGATDPINATNNTLRNPPLTGLISGTYVFRYSNVAGVCVQSSDQVRVVVSNSLPSTPNAGANQTVCAGSYRLNGSAVPATALAQWSVVSPVGASVSFSDATVANPIVSGLLASTTYIFRYTLTNGCGSSSDDVTITTNAGNSPTKPTITVSSTDCAATSHSFPLSLSQTVGHTALASGQTGVLSVVAVPAASLTSYIPGTSTSTTKVGTLNLNAPAAVSYIWTVSSSTCSAQSFSDTATRYYLAGTSTISAGPDQNICSVASFPFSTTLTGTSTVIPKQWSLIYSSNGQGVSFGSAASNSSTVSLPAAGTYTFKYELIGADPACQSMVDYVTIVVSSPGSLAQAGADMNVCNASGTFNLGAIPLASGTGLWTIEEVTTGVLPTIASPSSATSAITFSRSGTVVLRWSSYATNTTCGVTSSDLVTVTYVSPANAGADINLCNSTATNLNAVNPAPATGTWTRISGPNTPTIANSANPNTLLTGLVAGMYTYRWTVTNAGACITTDDVTITINAITATPNAGPDFTTCNGSTNNRILLNATAASGGLTGTWAVTSRPPGTSEGAFSNINDPAAVYTGATAAGTYIFSWTLSDGICSKTDFVTATVDPSSCITISGTVVNDANNSATILDGSETGTTAGTNLYVYLVSGSGVIVDSAKVATNGSYTLQGSPSSSYTLELSTQQYAIGTPGITTITIDNTLPSGWVTTGEGANNSDDGTPNGVLGLTTGTGNSSNVNFGIEQRPETNNQLLNITKNVEGGIIYSFPSLINLTNDPAVPQLSGSDPEDKPASTTDSISTGGTFVITTLPPAAQAVLYYNGTPLGAGVIITNYDPAKLQIEFKSGTMTTSFQYATRDAASMSDLSPATYQINLLGLLPVTGLKLSALPANGKVTLQWETITETNTVYFDVEQSSDGIVFTATGRVVSAGNSNKKAYYDFTSPLSSLAPTYYRITLYDKDGRKNYSNIVRVSNNNVITLFPNPASHSTTISGLTGKSVIEVLSIDGRLIQNIHTTNASYTIYTAQFVKGIYLIKHFEGGQLKNVLKLIKE